MKISRFCFFVSAFLLFSSSIGFAQLSVESGFFNEGIQVFNLSDLDLTTPNSKPIFWINLNNNSNQTRQVILGLKIYSDRYPDLASGETEQFDLPPGTLFITNQNLSQTAGDYKIAHFSINDEAANDFLSDVQATGKLPTDVYRFTFTLTEVVNPSNNDLQTIELNINNLNIIELLTPGRLVSGGDIVSLPVINNPQPTLIWESNAGEFDITVCEATDADPVTVMSNLEDARYHEQVTFPPETGDTKIQVYPSTALPLQEGKTYYWQVKAIINSASGEEFLESEIWGFTMASSSGNVSQNVQWQMLRNLLQRLTGSDDLASEIEKMFGGEGSTPAIGDIYFNNRPITLLDLQTMIYSNQMKSIDYIIEE